MLGIGWETINRFFLNDESLYFKRNESLYFKRDESILNLDAMNRVSTMVFQTISTTAHPARVP